jgi:hypothetical protein
MSEKVIVKEIKNNVIVSSPGPQGPRGRTILSGSTSPANNLGLEGDFYYNTQTTEFYGPKPTDISWSGCPVILLHNTPENYQYSWELAQVVGPIDDIYYVEINHNLSFHPNVTVKSSAGDVLETGIDYNSINKLTLTMSQPFSGTAYLS